MSTVIGIFSDSKMAGELVGQLKGQGYGDDVSVVAKDVNNSDISSHQVTQDVSDGTTAGAATGAALGALGALLVGATSLALPGVGLVALGPLATILTGTAAGAATGGLVGALVDWGIPDETAKDYEQRVQNGEVLIAVKTDTPDEAQAMMLQHGAADTSVVDR